MIDTEALKECTSCHTEKPRDEEHFAPYSGRSVDGLRPICRDCAREQDRERKRASRAKARKEKAR